jgi:hypothetical protein
MDIQGSPLVPKKVDLLTRQFARWWLLLNSLGLFSFGLFLGCLGTGEHRYWCAVISCLMVVWLYVVGKEKFPAFLDMARKSNDPDMKKLASEISKDYLPFIKSLFTHFPFCAGSFCLWFLAAYPIVRGQYMLYFPIPA